MRHLVVRSLLLTSVLVFLALGPGAAPPAMGACGDPGPACGGNAPCSCGDTVVTDTRLSRSDPVLQTACPFDGLFVASGVTLQINGTIRSATIQPFGCSGIVLPPGTKDVVVTTGRIVGFDVGIAAGAFGAPKVANSQFSRLQIVDSNFQGMFLSGDDNLIEGNLVTGKAFFNGILVREGVRNTVHQNEIENTAGIRLFSSDSIVSQNLSQRNAEGITVGGNNNIVDRNRAKYNGIGLGIEGTNHVVTHNVAERNDGEGIVVTGSNNTVDRNRSHYNRRQGFFVSGANHRLTLNLAGRNGTEGFGVCASNSNFSRNRSDNNFDFGIREFSRFCGGVNNYVNNRCTGNVLGPFDPSREGDPILCR